MQELSAKTVGLIAMVVFAIPVMLFGGDDEPKKTKPATSTKPAAVTNVTPAAMPDNKAKSRIKAYMDRLPGSMIVIVRGDSAGIIVETDYNFGTSDKETAKSLATNLIYRIMSDNGDCTFKSVSVNCMDGKKPVGVIVNYEDGIITTIP